MAENKPVSSLEIVPQGLGSSLATNSLAVPMYQRAFSWDEENVANFLTDVNTAFSNAEPEYFMGAIVLQGSEHSYAVVDGQQRLTTATVFIAATRDFLKAKGNNPVALSLETQFLLTKDTWTQQISPRMKLSVYDNDFFRKCILESEDIKPERESHQRLFKARNKCMEFLEALSKAHGDWFDRLSKLVNYIEHKTKIIQVIVPDEANAYVIFETLNDRGKDLSASDLLKNYLFGRAGDRLDEVQSKWNQMLGILESHGGDAIVITYIRQLWSATREVAREKELFAKIKAKIISAAQSVDFANELVARAEHYSAVLNPAHQLWKEKGGQAESLIRSLSGLKLERYRPALLGLLAKFEGKELEEAMRALLNGSVRYLIAIGAGGGSLEGAYSDVGIKVTSGEIKTAKAFAQELAKIIPNDDVFRTAFLSTRVSKPFLARYFLGALERAERGEQHCELVPNDDVAYVNLEHVLPENPGGNWPDFTPELAEAYARRLGNLALLSTKKNVDIGNESFAAKRAILAASDFHLTKSIGQCAKWGPDEIEARQVVLAELALKVWAYKV